MLLKSEEIKNHSHGTCGCVYNEGFNPTILEVSLLFYNFLFLISFWMLKEYTTSQRIFRLVALGELSILPTFSVGLK